MLADASVVQVSKGAMNATRAEPLEFEIDTAGRVSALLQVPPAAEACLVLAHGAGAGMTHPFMTTVADQLGERHIATLRYQFPYMEQGSRRPDPPALCQATVRAAVAEATRRVPRLALFAGGKSFGGRMTSQAQASAALPQVRGLAFFGFPLHPDGRPSMTRAEHLRSVRIPMLFLQGTRDRLADESLLTELVRDLGRIATLNLLADADHSFHVPARSGRSDAQVLAGMLDTLTAWMQSLTPSPTSPPAR
jgi:uncharacterized protein